MAANLITVEQACGHLHVDLLTDGASPPAIIDERYPDLLLKMAAAEAFVLSYVKDVPTNWTLEGVPEEARAAILLTLGELWDPTRANTGMIAGGIVDDSPVANLLRRLRDPAYA